MVGCLHKLELYTYRYKLELMTSISRFKAWLDVRKVVNNRLFGGSMYIVEITLAFFSRITHCVYILSSGDKKCPEDNTTLSLQQIFRDAFCNREILELECFCTNQTLGCNWTGPLRTLQVKFRIRIICVPFQLLPTKPRTVSIFLF